MSIAQSAAATAATEPARTGPTGPRTAEGKARCRLNAFRHGLTAQTFVFTSDEAAAFAKHSAAISDHYKPIGPVETILTAQIASAMWRLLRVHPIEEGIFAMDAALTADPNTDGIVTATSIIGPAHAWIEQAKSLDLLGKYERRLRRALDRDQAQLQQLQSTRKAQPTAVPQPAPTESVFSPDIKATKSMPRQALTNRDPVTDPVPVTNLIPDTNLEPVTNLLPNTNPEPVTNLLPDTNPEPVTNLLPNTNPEPVTNLLPDTNPEPVINLLPETNPVAFTNLVPLAVSAAARPRSNRPRTGEPNFAGQSTLAASTATGHIAKVL